jgi:DNA-binding transcriptional LysR family regulator
MDFAVVRALRAVAETSSITGAAELLGLTPSAVSQHLRSLEQRHGQALTVRSGRGIQLTESGIHLGKLAGVALAAHDELTSAIDELPASTTIRIATFGSGATSIVPLVVRGLLDEEPTWRFEVHVAEPVEAHQMLQRREVDLAFAFRYGVLGPAEHPAIHEQHLGNDDLRVVGLGRGRPVALNSLGDRTWLLPDAKSMCGELIGSVLTASGVSPRVGTTSADYTVLAQLAHAGAGIALIPKMCIPPNIASRQPITTHDVSLRRSVHRAWPARHEQTSAVRWTKRISETLIPESLLQRSPRPAKSK